MESPYLPLPLALLPLLLPLPTLAADQAADLPAVITAERGGFAPEGVEYDTAGERFLLGSVSEGKVFVMDSSGALTPLVEDERLKAVLGVEADEERGRLFAVSADAAVFGGQGSGSADLGVYGLIDGEPLALVDLDAADSDAPEGTRYFPNDVTVDAEGNAYVTDSFARQVYMVDSDYEASLFLTREQFPEEESLNGILAGEGFLLVAGPGTGTLYRAGLDDPASMTAVLTSDPVEGADGLVWTSDGMLAVASARRAYLLRSDDGWETAEVLASQEYENPAVASTIAAVGERLYVIFPHPGDPAPPTVELIDFALLEDNAD